MSALVETLRFTYRPGSVASEGMITRPVSALTKQEHNGNRRPLSPGRNLRLALLTHVSKRTSSSKGGFVEVLTNYAGSNFVRQDKTQGDSAWSPPPPACWNRS